VVAITPHSPVTTDDLTCTVTIQSTDPDGDSLTYTYKWYKDDVLNKTTSGTSSLTDVLSNTLTSDAEVWKCVVNANDGTTDGPAAQDQVTIGAPNLVIDSIVVITGGCNVFVNDTYVNGTDYYVPVQVKVKNIGIGSAGSFNVSLSTYSFNVSLQEDYVEWRVAGLNPGENTTLTFNWHAIHTGFYNLTAIADCHNEVVESNEGDNTLVLSQYPVYLWGDANGDGTVNIVDAVIVSLAWETHPGDPAWNIKADLNHNGVVNVSDGVRIGLHWNQTW
jgi:hypothetical protein